MSNYCKLSLFFKSESSIFYFILMSSSLIKSYGRVNAQLIISTKSMNSGFMPCSYSSYDIL